MNARLTPVEREVLEEAVGAPWATSTEIVAVVEAILLARKLRAQSESTVPVPRLRAVPPQHTPMGVVGIPPPPGNMP